MVSLNTHYKERDPNQTVQIVKDFFKEHKFELRDA